MSDRMYRRLTRLAVLAIWSITTILVAGLLPMPGYSALAVGVIASVPLYLAIGPYQADVALNSWLSDGERRWWRIALFLLPWTMALYWSVHVRR
jgi:hypothetical protein